MTLPLLRPDWPVPPGVLAAMSTRAGGVSSGPWQSLNLGVAVGDVPAAVADNRARFVAALAAEPVWLRQVHGVNVRRLIETSAAGPDEPADAAWTTAKGVACTVQAADCLPVLFAARDGSAVAAAHAGWRGLAAGVLESTLRSLQQGAGVQPAEVQVWLGPCIGPRQFEVGADVLQGFGVAAVPVGQMADQPLFKPCTRRDGSPGWLADLQGLAAWRLHTAGVLHVSRLQRCTVEEPSTFFSFRRDGVTGRMAASVWRS
ncbi:MAG: peptidoglycan editing factor PgeF [Rubrivivax sp.]|nr:peptidoglycan editing factor PgeF [Rubrivivax sp.]MDP3614093.1 peptidoglycan editing factor PgeF [Rubrivivax sp.]